MQSTQMRVSCPNCLTEYEVPDAALGGRSRMLRCERCGNQWRVGGPLSQSVPVARPAPDAHTHSWSPLPVEPEQNLTPVEPQNAPLLEASAQDEPSSQAPAARLFGQPADDAAHAEFVQAVEAEEKLTSPDAPNDVPFETEVAKPAAAYSKAEDGLPAFLTAQRGQDAGAGPPEAGEADQDRFAALIRAARNKSIEYEPEPKRTVANVNTSHPLFFAGLVLALIIVLVLVEHRHIAHFLGLK